MEKIRYCITKLDKELRGLDDIKDLKVTPPFHICSLPSVPLHFPCFQRALLALQPVLLPRPAFAA